MTDTALVIFKEMEVAPSLQTKILELEPNFPSLSEEEQREMISFLAEQAAKTIEGVKNRFPQIDVKHAGTTAFEMPLTAGQEDREYAKEFDGIILDQYLTKAYWKQAYGAGGKGAPDCASTDGLNPYVENPVNSPDQGGCISCPLNRFGSGRDQQGNKTRGKACRDVKRVVIWVDGHELPVRISISAANIKEFDGYMNDLRDQGQLIGSVRTKFKAVEASNRANVAYTGVQLTTVSKLSWPEMKMLNEQVIKPFKQDFRLGAIEAFEDGGTQQAPTDSEASGQTKKAADVMG